MNWKYTNIQHQVRLSLGLSLNEYCVFDVIYKVQTYPGSNGWCCESLKTIGDFFGISKAGVLGIIDKGVCKGFIEVDETNPRQRKATELWYSNAYKNNPGEVEYDVATVQKVNENVQKVNDDRSESERKRSESERHIRYKEINKKRNKGKEGDSIESNRPDPFSDFEINKYNTEQDVMSVLAQKIKAKEWVELLDGISLDSSEAKEKFAKYWTGMDRSLDKSNRRQVAGLVSSFRKWCDIERENTPAANEPEVDEPETDIVRVHNTADAILDAYVELSRRSISEETRTHHRPIIHRMLKDGVFDISIFRREAPRIFKIHSVWKSLLHLLPNWERGLELANKLEKELTEEQKLLAA